MVNVIKKYLSEGLRSCPQLKRFLVKTYLRLAYCNARVKYFFDPPKSLSLPADAITSKEGHSFFGYYDKCPWDRDSRRILYTQASFADRTPKPGEAAKVGFVDLNDNYRTHELGQTTTWSWQQGCMLQWLDGNSGQSVIYNDFQNGEYISVIRNLDGEIEKTLPIPVYAISRDNKKLLSLNFGRLHYGCEGYGYVAEKDPQVDQLYPANEGIRLLDMETGDQRLIISLDQIVKHSPKGEFGQSFHYFNHLEFNPAGTRFIFLHRWFVKLSNNARGKQYTRMFTANSDGTDIHCVADHGMVSHFAWKDDKHILVWANHPLSGHRYYLIEDETENITIVGDGILTEDGHPSYSPNGKWILTDTYPNKGRLRTLILFDALNSKRIDIGIYKSPFKFDGPWKCDLHPRWNRDGTKVCFDSAHEGLRRIYVVDASSIS